MAAPRDSTTPVSGMIALVIGLLGGLGLIGAMTIWLIKQFTASMQQANDRAVEMAARTAQAQSSIIQDQLETLRGSMPVGRSDVGDLPPNEQTEWEAQLPWFMQGPGYDPTDDRLPDPTPSANEDRTVLIEPGTDILSLIARMPSPPGVNIPTPDMAGEMDGI